MGKRYRRDSAIRRMKRARFRRACLNVLAGILAVMLMSLFFIFCHDIIIQSPYYKITSINVSGNKRLNVQEVLDAAHIKSDANLLQINVPLSRKYLLAHPWIVSAEITRDLPGNLLIHIEEQQPLAILDTGRKFLLNREGKVFKELSDTDAIELPVVEGLNYTDVVSPDTHRSQPYEAVMALLELGEKPDAVLPDQQIRRILVDRDDGITLFSTGTVQSFSVNSVKLGYQDYAEKFVRLRKIISYFKNSKAIPGIDWIDLRQMNRVVISPLSAEPPTDGRKEI